MLTLFAGRAESLWDEALPVEVRELPTGLAALDRLLSDPELLSPILERWRREVSESGRAVLSEGRPTIAMLDGADLPARGRRARAAAGAAGGERGAIGRCCGNAVRALARPASEILAPSSHARAWAPRNLLTAMADVLTAALGGTVVFLLAALGRAAGIPSDVRTHDAMIRDRDDQLATWIADRDYALEQECRAIRIRAHVGSGPGAEPPDLAPDHPFWEKARHDYEEAARGADQLIADARTCFRSEGGAEPNAAGVYRHRRHPV